MKSMANRIMCYCACHKKSVFVFFEREYLPVLVRVVLSFKVRYFFFFITILRLCLNFNCWIWLWYYFMCNFSTFNTVFVEKINNRTKYKIYTVHTQSIPYFCWNNSTLICLGNTLLCASSLPSCAYDALLLCCDGMHTQSLLHCT